MQNSKTPHVNEISTYRGIYVFDILAYFCNHTDRELRAELRAY